MTATISEQSTIMRTERGLSIAGTRITLYDILEYLHADWPRRLIKNWLNLTDGQMDAALAYIEAHRDEVEQEYQQVVRAAEEIRQYWEERNREYLARKPKPQRTPEQEAIWAKLQAWKEQRGLT